MEILNINEEICINCGECEKTCPNSLFSSASKKDSKIKMVFNDPFKACIQCGHCISICPTNAINFKNSDPCVEGDGIIKPELVSYDKLMDILRGRRSIRQYKDKQVPKKEIEAVLESMRYAPSASNEQNWEYIVLTDQEQIQNLSKKITDMVKLTYKLVSNKIVKNLFIWGKMRELVHDPSFLYSMKNMLDKVEKGIDPLFFNAPVVIILHSPVYGNLSGCDSGISLTYGMLAAQSRGLGTCWIGVAQETMQRVKKISKFVGVPKGRKVWGVLTLGYPKVNFLRAPPRKSLKIKWN